MSGFVFLRKSLTIFSVRNIIITLISLSLCYLASSLIYPWIYLREIKLEDLPAATFDGAAQTEGQQDEQETAKPLDFYVQKIKNRQMWTNPGREQANPSGAGIAQAEILKNISLLGVISAAEPQAVIEDKNAQKTYYVTKGQFIGDYQIENIQEGKIILNYNGQKYELYM